MTILDLIDENKINYEMDKNIDLNELHAEWLRQPGLCGNYNKLLAQAERERDKAKEQIPICKANVDEARARLELDIRKSPVVFGLGDMKVTESWISSTVIVFFKKNEDCVKTAEELVTAQNNLIEANYKVGVYGSGVKAMVDRKAALEKLVDLWSRNYFSVPTAPRPIPEEYQNVRAMEQDEIVEKQREGLQKKAEVVKKGSDEWPTRRRRG